MFSDFSDNAVEIVNPFMLRQKSLPTFFSNAPKYRKNLNNVIFTMNKLV